LRPNHSHEKNFKNAKLWAFVKGLGWGGIKTLPSSGATGGEKERPQGGFWKKDRRNTKTLSRISIEMTAEKKGREIRSIGCRGGKKKVT